MWFENGKRAGPFRAPFGAIPTHRNYSGQKMLRLNREEGAQRGMPPLGKKDPTNLGLRIGGKERFGVHKEDQADSGRSRTGAERDPRPAI